MKQKARDISSEPLFSRRALFRLLWPLVIEQLLTVLVGVIDVFMVAYIGEAAVSGVALVDAVIYLFIQVIFAVTGGGTVVCAQFIGARDLGSASKTGAQLALVAVGAMLLVSAVFLLAGPQILGFLFGSVSDEVMGNALTYLGFTVSSLPFMALFYSAASSFRANGETRISMLAALFMNFLNVGGNALCIFALNMGVVGVALSTLVARAAAAFCIFAMLQRKGNPLRITGVGQFRPDKAIIAKILSIGVPNGVESGLFNLGKILLQSLVATLGTASIAAYAVAGSLVTFLYLPGNALGAGMLTIVGQCFGAGEMQQARRYVRILIALNYAMLAVICAVMIGGARVWVGLYGLSAEASSSAVELVVAHSIAMIIWPLAFSLPYYFRAIGRATFPMIVSVTTMAVLRVGLAYLFVAVLGFGLIWVWYAMFIDWVARMIVFVVAFRKVGRWGQE